MGRLMPPHDLQSRGLLVALADGVEDGASLLDAILADGFVGLQILRRVGGERPELLTDAGQVGIVRDVDTWDHVRQGAGPQLDCWPQQGRTVLAGHIGAARHCGRWRDIAFP